ncbi:MAG: DUF2500 domain-containing protein [Lachnospiraceae bacterium]|nr:DUF2500 domain-containing protein [Lachnospiraceae bacterium]
MGFFGMGASLFRILFIAVFLLVLFVIISNMIRGVGQWNRNNQSPVLNVLATVVAKREEVSYHHHHDNMAMGHSSTSYYVTFEVESGDRMEFRVSGSEYGMLIEQDFGSLKFQGTRFLGFEREL